MIIKNGCAILRPIEERDCELLKFMINDPDIESGTIGWHYPISEIQQREWMRSFKNNDSEIRLMIELTNQKTIGLVSLTNIDWKNRTAAPGYKISASAEDRIRGDMADALTGLFNYAFNELGMNCLYSTILEDNTFSRKLSKKFPWKLEGVLRQRIFKVGTYKNLIASSMLREEFNAIFRPDLI